MRRREFIAGLSGIMTWPIAVQRPARGKGDPDRMQARAAELVGLMPEVILTGAGASTRAVEQATRTIPIVAAAAGEATFAATKFNRPEGNLTGFAILYPSIAGKWLQLVKEIAPNLARVALVFNPSVVVAGNSDYRAAAEVAAKALGLKATDAPFRDAQTLSGQSMPLRPSRMAA
jgi:putative tryptophan/tyrosine transport system substrate-binding protein